MVRLKTKTWKKRMQSRANERLITKVLQPGNKKGAESVERASSYQVMLTCKYLECVLSFSLCSY